MITSSDRQFKGGLVVPYFICVSEEDEGQDEKTENDPQYVRLGAITLIKHNNQSKLFNYGPERIKRWSKLSTEPALVKGEWQSVYRYKESKGRQLEIVCVLRMLDI